MGTTRAKMGRIHSQGILPLLKTLNTMEWGGVLRLRFGTQIGAVWWVKGQIVHAVHYEGKSQMDGIPALDAIILWKDGTFLLEADVLPPARSIRTAMEDILKRMESRRTMIKSGESPADSEWDLESLLDELRHRVPGLESVSICRGTVLEETTEYDETEKEWLAHQLQIYMADDDTPETLYVQQQGHTLLIVKNGLIATVLSAQSATAPEALFWASQEAQRRLPVLK